MEKFYENGVKSSSRQYVDGKVQGRSMFYLRSQETMYVTYKDDVANGPVEVLNKDGKRVLRGEFKAGKFHGLFQYYDATGKKLAEGRYDRGAPHTGSFVIGNKIATYQKGRLLKTEPMPGTAHGATEPAAPVDDKYDLMLD
jgi:antitoxin component YwqK of YwqJK toxin-antitoxin module